VSNLVGNAVAHGDISRPIKILLAASLNEIRMTVQNYGNPIDPALLPTLFNPFKRGDDTRWSAGLGLGLYISERIIAAHRGTVSVTSSLEQGTIVEVGLPKDLGTHDAKQ
jgi:phosphoserine phosphatase RsbU/P